MRHPFAYRFMPMLLDFSLVRAMYLDLCLWSLHSLAVLNVSGEKCIDSCLRPELRHSSRSGVAAIFQHKQKDYFQVPKLPASFPYQVSGIYINQMCPIMDQKWRAPIREYWWNAPKFLARCPTPSM
ncbi:hypothetical protein BDR22DRAFT_848947, partial [Usnea florida]